MHKNYWVLGACAGVTLGALASFSCSADDFESCEEARTCREDAGMGGSAGTGGGAGSGGASGKSGSGGAAGDAGMAGMAGDGNEPPADCETDGECIDDSLCNGVESCVEGLCQPGTPIVCPNADPVHCLVECAEAAAGECQISALDEDEDGHATVECAAAPGDDCDDTRDDVYLGATEICDRVDNDCDMLVDLDDGLPLSGTVRQIGTTSSVGRKSATVAWSPVSSVYGLLWMDPALSATADLYYVAVDQGGTFTGTAKPMNMGRNVSTRNRVGLSWGGEYFTVAWVDNNPGATIHQRKISSGGDLISVLPPSFAVNGSTGVHIAHTSDGTLGAIWERVDQGGAALFARSMSPANVLGAEVQLVIADVGPYQPDESYIAAVGNRFVVTWDEDDLPKAIVADSAFATRTPLTAFGRRPTVGSGPSGFAIAASASAAGMPPQVQMFNAEGGVLCGPMTFADAEFSPEAVVGSERGYVVVSRGQLRAQEIALDCTPGALFSIDPSNASGVRVAHGNAGYAVVWQDTSLGVPKFRLFGENFCD